ncbi:3D domain-containing protein [Paenibacillus oleatilyticus]|uniref:3D domain-containing protein n=1 Tax=Paenibacillus oleatilyticus TaxID=2594886 RepID=UPI001C1FB8B0|nr:3D domain-containing protein [Paenibacillus oleatilyticus]MBU7316033.1 3D domain-containing protein [Paenibacillus oleatilyticus]
MRKTILSSIVAIILVCANSKVAISIGETKNTNKDIVLTAEEEKVLTKYTLMDSIEEPEPVDSPDAYKIYSVTAFTSGYESTQKKKGHPLYGITASGERVKEGVTAACPKSLEFGTKVYVKELDHTYICQDRGGAIKEGNLDIYFDDLKKAKEFGRQKLHVKIKDD